VTPAEAKSRLAGDPTFDLWDEAKQAWFCGRVVAIRSAIEGMKGPDYGALSAKAKSSLRKSIAVLKPLEIEAIDYLAEGLNGDMTGALVELTTLKRTAKRLLAMPKPDHLIELMTEDGPECGYSGGDDRWSRLKWRNDVATQMVHELIKDAGVKGSLSMKLAARVFDCLRRRGRLLKSETVRKRLARPTGKNRRKK
jgi:hypothetical protein